jgi:hypothetical protein
MSLSSKKYRSICCPFCYCFYKSCCVGGRAGAIIIRVVLLHMSYVFQRKPLDSAYKPLSNTNTQNNNGIVKWSFLYAFILGHGVNQVPIQVPYNNNMGNLFQVLFFSMKFNFPWLVGFRKPYMDHYLFIFTFLAEQEQFIRSKLQRKQSAQILC